MAIITRTVLDHVYIQFAYGGTHQVGADGEPLPIGALSGMHQAHVEYLVDGETGAIIGETNNPANRAARPLTQEVAADLLGEKFAGVALQVQSLGDLLQAKTGQVTFLTTELDLAKGKADGLAAALDAAQTAAAADLTARDETIAALQAQIADLTAPAATARTYMSDLWRRATDGESTVIEAIIAGLSPKQRNLLNSVTYLDHADPQFPDIVAALTQAFGAARAGELLAPST